MSGEHDPTAYQAIIAAAGAVFVSVMATLKITSVSGNSKSKLYDKIDIVDDKINSVVGDLYESIGHVKDELHTHKEIMAGQYPTKNDMEKCSNTITKSMENGFKNHEVKMENMINRAIKKVSKDG